LLADKATLVRNNVTPKELRVLSHISLLGVFKPRDYLFILTPFARRSSSKRPSVTALKPTRELFSESQIPLIESRLEQVKKEEELRFEMDPARTVQRLTLLRDAVRVLRDLDVPFACEAFSDEDLGIEPGKE
jgi:hypothetical protein